MPASLYAENKILDHVFLGSAFAQPSAIWVQLHLGNPGSAGTANPATETTRKQVASFAAASGGSKASSAAATWNPYPTVSGSSETISHLSLWDAATAGNCLWYGAVATPTVIATGGRLDLNSGNLTATLT